MRITLPMMAAALALGGVALAATPATAQTARKKPPAKKKPPKPDPWATERAMREMLQGGGVVGEPNNAPAPEPRATALPMRTTLAQANGYTLYREAPGYCTLYLDTPRRAMIRMSYRADGTTNFSYVRPGLALDPSTPSYPALFQFDGANGMTGYAAQDTQLDDGRAGFALVNAGEELLNAWGSGQSVAIRLGAVAAKPIDTIALAGAAPMVRQFKACARDSGSTPPPETARSSSYGRLRKVTPTVAPPPVDLGGAGTTTLTNRRFPNGEHISLSFEPAGVGGTGTIAHRAPGQPTRQITIGYMSEFTAIPAANRVRYSVMGTTDRGQESWACEITIDWRTAKVITVRDLSGSAYPSCKESL